MIFPLSAENLRLTAEVAENAEKRKNRIQNSEDSIQNKENIKTIDESLTNYTRNRIRPFYNWRNLREFVEKSGIYRGAVSAKSLRSKE